MQTQNVIDLTDTLNKNIIYCFHGIFDGAKITTSDGIVKCRTFKIIWEKAKDREGFYNISWREDTKTWCIIQYIIIE